MNASTLRMAARGRNLLVALLLVLMSPIPAIAAALFTVTTVDDTGPGSLRQAITDANAVALGTSVTIEFKIPGAGPHLIQPAAQLPSLHRGDITIDGYTQPGSSVNTLALGQNNAVLKIHLDGNSTIPTAFDFTPESSSNFIRGLSITRFTDAAFAQRNSSFGGGCCTVLTGNWIGFAPDGTPQPNRYLFVANNAPQYIGQSGEANQNLIVTTHEVLQANGLSYMRLWNNMFGVRPDGTPLPGGYFQGGAILRGGFGFCCPGSSFTAFLFVGDPVQGGNIFAAMSGSVVQAAAGTILSRNLFIDPPTFVSEVSGSEPAPFISAVTFGNGSTVIAGGFNTGKANQDMRMEFFANDTPDPQAFGAADTYLGATVVTSDAASAGSFTFTGAGNEYNLSVTKTPGDNTSQPAIYIGPHLAGSPSPAIISAAVGSPVTQIVTITNSGNNFVTFGTLSIIGTDLSIVADTCSGQTIPGSGSTCMATVQFAPAGLGTSSGRISAPVVAAGSPVTITGITTTFVSDITATALPPAYALSVNRIGNGAGHVASSEVPPVIDCGPTCSANYAIGSIVTLVAAPDQGSSFAFWAGDCTGTQPTCTVMLSQARSVSAAFVLGSVATGGTVAMSLAAPDSIVLGQPLTVSVSLTGTPPGAITGSVTFFNGPTALCTNAQPVVANAASCTVTPATTMPLAVWATYSGSPSYQPSQTTPRAVAVLQSSGARIALDFGTVPVGGTSDSQTVLAGNPTASTIGIAISTTGDYAATHTCPAQLAPGASCPITITFHPGVAGTRNGALVVQSTNPSASTQIDLTGSGLAPVQSAQLSVAPDGWFFGDVNVGFGGPTSNFTITNTGTTAAAGLAIGSLPGYSVHSSCPSTLAPSASCSFALQFTPPSAGFFNGTLQIGGTNVVTPAELFIYGEGVAAPRVKLAAMPPAVTAAPGVPSLLKVLVYRDAAGCRAPNGTTSLGDCPTHCEITGHNSSGLPTSTTTSGACSLTCGLGGNTCVTVTDGQGIQVQQGVSNVHVDWSATNACQLSAGSSLSGSDGSVNVSVTVPQPGLCEVSAMTPAAPTIPAPFPGFPATVEKATITVDASAALQATAATLACTGDATASGSFQYRKEQGTGTFSLGFTARTVQGAPAPNVRIAIAASTLHGAIEQTTDATGKVSVTIGIATNHAQDYAVQATVAGTGIGGTCNVRVLPTIATIVEATGTELPENVINSAGQFVGSRSGKFCALLKDAAGDPYNQSGETVDFAGPAQTPTVKFTLTNNNISHGDTNASGIACSKTAVMNLEKPNDAYNFQVVATYRFKDNSTIQKSWTLTRTSASQNQIASGNSRMSAVNSIQSAVVGSTYGQDLCVSLEHVTGQITVQCTPSGMMCPVQMWGGTVNVPVLFEVLSAPGGPSVGLRPSSGTGSAVSSLTVNTGGSTGRACVKATANMTAGTAYVQATSSVGTMLFTLSNTSVQPDMIAMGASTVSIASSSLYGEPITVQVKNAAGVPVAGATVNFTIHVNEPPWFPGESSPTVSPRTVATNNQGLATAFVMANGSFRSFSVTATTLLPSSGNSASGVHTNSIDNGVFEVEYYFATQLVPDPGLDPTGDADGDGIPNAVEIAQGNHVLDRDNDVFADSRLFPMQQYRDFLSREGEAQGIAYYTDLLDAGAIQRANIIENFFNSPEFQGVGSPVARLYFATFLRIPDYDGLLFQIGAFRNGAPLAAIANNFTLSPEFTQRYGAIDNAQYVALLYQNVLGRAPVQSEVDFHVNRLATGATRGDVLVGFSESPEYQANTAHGVYVTMMYVGMLRRAPEQAGFDYWTNYMDTGSSGLALILGFLQAPEYHDRFLQ